MIKRRMNKTKHLSILISISLFGNLLSGCATSKNLGDGTVIQQQKIADKTYNPKNGTLVGAGIGAGTGAATGAYIGAVAGAISGMALSIGTFGLGTVMIPSLAAAGAVTGTAVGGLTGGATGAGVGYATDVYKQGVGVYQYTVKPDNQPNNLIVTQYEKKPLSLQARVKILLKNDRYYVEPLSTIR